MSILVSWLDTGRTLGIVSWDRASFKNAQYYKKQNTRTNMKFQSYAIIMSF